MIIIQVGIFVNTPAQVHFYRNIIKKLKEDNNDAVVVARNYRETIDLLKELDIPYHVYSSPPTSKFGKIFALPKDILNAYKYLKGKRVNIVTGFGLYNTLTAVLLRVPDILFNDSEPIANTLSYDIQVKIFMIFTSVLITPASFRQNLGRKQLRIESYKEMAYLHPNYYKPNDQIYNLLNIPKGTNYVILRFNAFDAVHDAGINGFCSDDKISLVKELEKYAHVFISSENGPKGVPDSLGSYILNIPKNRIHDALYFAKMLVTDTQTMATESAILGTPTIRCNTFVGKNDMGNFIELENRYGLLFNYRDTKEAINKAIDLIKDPNLKDKWAIKRGQLLHDKKDIINLMVNAIENYHDSITNLRK